MNEGNLREVKTSNALMHSAHVKRTGCNYPSCNLNPYLDSKSFTPLIRKKEKTTMAENEREKTNVVWGIRRNQRSDHVYQIP